jgi:protoheme IX farnesyltransferase
MCHGSLIPHFEYHELVEWNHRFFSVLGGFLMVVMGLSTLIWYRKSRRLFWLALLAGFTYIAQAVIGGITVLLHLDKTWIALHMGNSMILLAAVTLLALFSRIGEVKFNEKKRLLRNLSLVLLIWTYIALFTGSAVVGADADLACANWPECSSTSILPETVQGWVNFTHRLAVGGSDVMMLVLAVVVWRSGRRKDKRLMTTTRWLMATYVGQIFLGAFTVWLGAPEVLKGAHLALAAATWSALVIMTTFIWIGPKVTATNNSGDGTSDTTDGTGTDNTLTKARTKNKKGQEWLPEPVRNYLSLMRLNVIPLLLVPTGAAMLMAAVQHPTDRNLLVLMALTLAGGTLTTGGAHTLNQYIERDIDARMKRTKRRPMVTGRIKPVHGLAFGLGLTGVGVVELWLTVNPLAAILALAGNLFYVLVYTIWLKRTTVQNIVIGGAAGAVPPLVGWAAVTGSVGLPALLFFAIIFFWTPAHFWALSLVRQEEYTLAGVPMLPVVRGEAVTRYNILAYALLLLVVTLIPFTLHALSWLYLVTAVGLGLIFVQKAVSLVRNGSTARAWKLFKFSNTYLALLYLVMVIDRLVVLSK